MRGCNSNWWSDGVSYASGVRVYALVVMLILLFPAAAPVAAAMETAAEEVEARLKDLGREGRKKLISGDTAGAEACFRQASELAGEHGLVAQQGVFIGRMGQARSRAGDRDGALDLYLRGYELIRREGSEAEKGRILFQIGITYAHFGRDRQARQVLESSLEIARRTGDHRKEGAALLNLGIVAIHQDDFGGALEYLQPALALAREQPLVRLVPLLEAEVGIALMAGGDPAAALPHFRAARSVAEEKGDTLMAMRLGLDLGMCRREAGDLEGAEAVLVPAWQWLEKQGPLFEVARSRVTMGDLRRDQGRETEALEMYSKAVQAMEEVRAGALADELKVGFYQGGRWDIFERPISLLVERASRQQDGSASLDLALGLVERGKGGASLDLLARSARRPAAATVEARALMAEEQACRRKITRIISAELTGPAASETGRTEARARLAAAYEELDRLKIRLQRLDPAAGNIVWPELLDAGQIRAGLAGTKTVVLDYFVGREYSYVFAVSAEGLAVQPIDNRAALRRRVEGYLEQVSRPVSAANPPPAYLEQSRALYRHLVEPVLSAIEPGAALLISPDGPLHHLPFETLVIGSDGADRPVHLVQRASVRYTPSVSMTAWLEEHRRPGNSTSMTQLAALGNPSLGASAKAGRNRTSGRPTDRGGASGLFAELELVPLAGAAAEVNGLRRLFGDDRSHVLLGNAATEEAVKTDGRIAGAQYLHFATHGFWSEAMPELSSLVLAQDGDPTEDGLLQVHEIAGLSLASELVVLSACRSGQGTLRTGEGLIGLPRAFLAAGAGGVVMSQWAVSDRATSEMMNALYRRLREGEPPAEALAGAKREMLESKRALYRHPYYWGPFVLTGGS